MNPSSPELCLAFFFVFVLQIFNVPVNEKWQRGKQRLVLSSDQINFILSTPIASIYQDTSSNNHTSNKQATQQQQKLQLQLQQHIKCVLLKLKTKNCQENN